LSKKKRAKGKKIVIARKVKKEKVIKKKAVSKLSSGNEKGLEKSKISQRKVPKIKKSKEIKKDKEVKPKKKVKILSKKKKDILALPKPPKKHHETKIHELLRNGQKKKKNALKSVKKRKEELLKKRKEIIELLKLPKRHSGKKEEELLEKEKETIELLEPPKSQQVRKKEEVQESLDKGEEEVKELPDKKEEEPIEERGTLKPAKGGKKETLVEEREDLERKELTKFKLGIKGFDDLFKEGIPEGASVLVEGGPGSGKTIFCLQLAHTACLKGKKVLYMTFEEPVRRLRHHMRSFGWDPEKYEKSGRLMIRKFNSLDVARSVEALLSEAKRELLIDIQPILIPQGFEPDIVCIDSLSSIASAFSGEESRFRIYIEQLFRYLESHDITSFLIRETSIPTHLGVTFVEKGSAAVSFLSDGIICLYNIIYYDGKRGRAIEVLKMRGEDIDRRIVEVEIVDKKGLIVHPDKHIKIKQEKGSYKLT